MDFGSFSGYVLLGILFAGFVVVTIIQQLLGRNFSWRQELD